MGLAGSRFPLIDSAAPALSAAKGVLQLSTLQAGSHLQAVLPSLSQSLTNGLSNWGTASAPVLSNWLTNNPLPNGRPWGALTDWADNTYTSMPTTGVIRTYDFTVTRGKIAPDGYLTDVILVNGQYPGPLVEANWGDKIIVSVHNNISSPDEGTAFHWHGFLQKDTPWEDGVPGVTQCPITPGQSYTYEFMASLYGTSWYHSHWSAQYTGGLVGPMIIHGPTMSRYDIDLGPVMLSDWYHTAYDDLLDTLLAPNGPRGVYSDNNLINGKMNFDCSTLAAGDTRQCTDKAGLSTFKFTTGKTHRLRLVNVGSEAVQRFSIDGHTMTVIANDFVPIKPYDTTVVTLGIGQRSDVLVKATGTSKSSYWMRSNTTSCSQAKQPFAVAVVYYDKADPDQAPTSKPWNVPDPGTCANDALELTVPLYPVPVKKPTFTHSMNVQVFKNASGVNLWRFGDVSMRANFNDPILQQANRGDLDFDARANVINLDRNTTVRIIVNNLSPVPHPMHLHGPDMLILAEGAGQWDGNVVRPDRPMRRDVQQVVANGYVVIQFDTQPGVWAFHCHIAWHASAGFFSQFLVEPEEVEKMKIPYTTDQVCKDWDRWSKRNVVDQIDSGT